jgi:hypothetical protein
MFLAEITIVVVRQRLVVIFDLFWSGIGRNLQYFVVIFLSSMHSGKKIFGLFVSSESEVVNEGSAEHLFKTIIYPNRTFDDHFNRKWKMIFFLDRKECYQLVHNYFIYTNEMIS